MPVPDDFIRKILSEDEKTVSIPVPGGGTVTGEVTRVDRDGDILMVVQGFVKVPEAGRFFFQKQTVEGKAGPIAGFIYYDKSDTAYRISPSGENGAPLLELVSVNQVICRSYLAPPKESEETPEESPQTHPDNYPIPPSENGIIQLQSLPGATAVVYLDFDGEEENFLAWGYIKALPSGTSNAGIYQVWKGVCEDFQPFNINVTTQRSVYEAAPQGRRMHVIVTPTDDAAPDAGGVAYLTSFNQTGHRVCWVFITSGKSCVEAISHEVGHTLGLSHDGRTSPVEEYYLGDSVSKWAPIMGAGYYQPLTQWSKGEYPYASETEDDLAIIVGNNNDVAYRVDKVGATYATAAYLDISSGGGVSNEGIIETRSDEDSFRFSTTGGTVSLNINGASFNQNLDIKAEIVSSAGTVISTSDPTSPGSFNASFTSLNLSAGDYFLRVSGTGNSSVSPGYSNYGSLGTYIITGTVNGGVYANHLTVAENSANGTTVGTVQARVSHGGGVLQYSIASGNGSGAFSINSATGVISVANSSILDFETLSTRWDDPASFELFVTITDSLGTATESLRTVVTVLDVNEPPVVAPLAAVTLPERLAVGSVVTTVTAQDPDRFDFASYSIVTGNVGNAFSIHPNTGVVTVSGALDFETTPTYSLTIRVSDQRSPTSQVDVPLNISLLNIAEDYNPGAATRTYYNGISGTSVSNLTSSPNFPNSPSSEERLSSFDGGTDKGDNYGSTIRAYLIAPVTGNYTFWISSDEASELRISPDATVGNAVVRASLASATTRYNWTANSSQQSASIPLVAGMAYYIEARHKEGSGTDHLEVAWQVPGASAKEVIPGRWLSPFVQPYPPTVSSQSASVRELAPVGQRVLLVTATDVNIGQTIANYAITAGNGAGLFAINATTGEITVANSAGLVAGNSYVLTVQATDNDSPAMSGTGTITIQVIGLQEQLHAWWKLDDGAGTIVSDSSGSGRNATLAGLAGWTTYGRSLGALTLDGISSHFDYLGNSSLSGTVPFTVMAWVKATQPFSSNGILIQQRENSSSTAPGQYRVYLRTDGQINFNVYGKDASGLNEGNQFDLTTSGVSVTDGGWHHVVCVRDGNAGRIFVDGVQRASGSGAVRVLDPTLTVAVGFDAKDNTSFLKGTVDDVRIYESALGLSQIQKIISSPIVNITSPTADQVRIPAGVGLVLEANASDLSENTPVMAWSMVSGPGAVTFGRASDANTTAVFATPGTYLLRLSATADGGTGTDDVSVIVGGEELPLSGYTYGGGAAGSYTSVSATSFVLTGSSTGIKSGDTADGFYFLGQTFTGDFDVKTRIASGTNIIGGAGENAGLIVRQGGGGAANEISSFIGCDTTPSEWGYWVRRSSVGAVNVTSSYSETAMKLPTWCRLARVGSTVTAYHSDNGTSWTTRGTIQVTGDARVGLCWSSGEGSTSGSATFDNVSGFYRPNAGPTVNAGADITVAAVGTKGTLNGVVTDDNLPSGSAPTTTWTKQSGLGAVTFVNPSAIVTSASSSAPGVHVLRLEANDGQVKTFDEMVLTVNGKPWPYWQQQKFGSQASDPLIAGDLADPDHDGLVNLLEYALGTEPMQANSGVIVRDMETVGGVDYLRLTATKSSVATDVVFSIEVSGDISVPGLWNTADTVVEVNNATTLQARDAVKANKRFIRLKVTRTP